MNEKIKDIVEKAGGFVSLTHGYEDELIIIGCTKINKFVGLIKQELYNDIDSWMATTDQIAEEPDVAVKQWLEGYNQGIVDALCEVKMFGTTNEHE